MVAQDPDNPGVLVLSRFAGAAEQLEALVNPYDPQGMADSIQQALQMPLAERQARHQKLMARIKEHDVHWWRKAFLDALQAGGLKPLRHHAAAAAAATHTHLASG
jgi:trehalose 6-phosphate synthase